jgi:hypothetical protein
VAGGKHQDELEVGHRAMTAKRIRLSRDAPDNPDGLPKKSIEFSLGLSHKHIRTSLPRLQRSLNSEIA